MRDPKGVGNLGTEVPSRVLRRSPSRRCEALCPPKWKYFCLNNYIVDILGSLLQCRTGWQTKSAVLREVMEVLYYGR